MTGIGSACCREHGGRGQKPSPRLFLSPATSTAATYYHTTPERDITPRFFAVELPFKRHAILFFIHTYGFAVDIEVVGKKKRWSRQEVEDSVAEE